VKRSLAERPNPGELVMAKGIERDKKANKPKVSIKDKQKKKKEKAKSK